MIVYEINVQRKEFNKPSLTLPENDLILLLTLFPKYPLVPAMLPVHPEVLGHLHPHGKP